MNTSRPRARRPLPVMPVALLELWASYFQRVEQGQAMVLPFRRGVYFFFLLRSATTVVMVGDTAPGDSGLGGELSFLGFLTSLLARC